MFLDSAMLVAAGIWTCVTHPVARVLRRSPGTINQSADEAVCRDAEDWAHSVLEWLEMASSPAQTRDSAPLKGVNVLSEGVTVAVLTVAVYGIAFGYEAGFAQYFGIPTVLIATSPNVLLTAAAVVLGLLSHSLYIGPHSAAAWRFGLALIWKGCLHSAGHWFHLEPISAPR
jgi:hypothetical protein